MLVFMPGDWTLLGERLVALIAVVDSGLTWFLSIISFLFFLHRHLHVRLQIHQFISDHLLKYFLGHWFSSSGQESLWRRPLCLWLRYNERWRSHAWTELSCCQVKRQLLGSEWVSILDFSLDEETWQRTVGWTDLVLGAGGGGGRGGILDSSTGGWAHLAFSPVLGSTVLEPDLNNLVWVSNGLSYLHQLFSSWHLIDSVTTLQNRKLFIRYQWSYSGSLLSSGAGVQSIIIVLVERVVITDVTITVIAVVSRGSADLLSCRPGLRLEQVVEATHPHDVVLHQSPGHQHVDWLQQQSQVVRALPTHGGVELGVVCEERISHGGRSLRVERLEQRMLIRLVWREEVVHVGTETRGREHQRIQWSWLMLAWLLLLLDWKLVRVGLLRIFGRFWIRFEWHHHGGWIWLVWGWVAFLAGHVRTVAAGVGEPLVTMIALERFVSCVYPDVLLQTNCLCELNQNILRASKYFLLLVVLYKILNNFTVYNCKFIQKRHTIYCKMRAVIPLNDAWIWKPFHNLNTWTSSSCSTPHDTTCVSASDKHWRSSCHRDHNPEAREN